MSTCTGAKIAQNSVCLQGFALDDAAAWRHHRQQQVTSTWNLKQPKTVINCQGVISPKDFFVNFDVSIDLGQVSKKETDTLECCMDVIFNSFTKNQFPPPQSRVTPVMLERSRATKPASYAARPRFDISVPGQAGLESPQGVGWNL